jgi:hypothetical protein
MIDDLRPLLGKFLTFAKDRLNFQKPPRLFLKRDASNGKCSLGKTAHYDPAEASITLYIINRHPKDVLRSFAHELVHHCQNERGDLAPEKMKTMNQNYAQENDHMRKMEAEAYLDGNLCFRDWEDGLTDKLKYKMRIAEQKYLKENNKMSVKITKKYLKETITRLLESDHQDRGVATFNEADLKSLVAVYKKSGYKAFRAKAKEIVGAVSDTPASKRIENKLMAKARERADFKTVHADRIAARKNKGTPPQKSVAGEEDQPVMEQRPGKLAASVVASTDSQGSNIGTPEDENDLYESRFTARNNKLFTKLLKEWAK